MIRPTPFPTALHRMLPVALALACLVVPSTSHAQDGEQKTEEQKSATSKPAAAAATEKAPLRYAPNVKVDVTITDQAAANAPIVKTVSAIVGQNQSTSIRSLVQMPVISATRASGDTKIPINWRIEELPLNVDLYSETVDATHVRVGLSLNYRTVTKRTDTGSPGRAVNLDATDEPAWTAGITQKFSVFLDSGKPLVISQSADAATDRKVTIEVKATILK